MISFFTAACLEAVRRGIASRLVAWADYDPRALADWASARSLAGVSIEGFILSQRVVAPLHEAGLSVSVGAINTVGQLSKVLPLAPDIVVSDRPGELRAAV